MVPFYIYYSMFGFQRIGDLAWLAGDIQSPWFLNWRHSGRTHSMVKVCSTKTATAIFWPIPFPTAARMTRPTVMN